MKPKRILLILLLLLVVLSCSKETTANSAEWTTEPADSISLNDTVIQADTTIRRDTITIIDTTEITPCSIYQGHLVVFVDTAAEDAILLTFISLSDWDKVHSANSSSPSFDTLINNYSEQDLAEWHIPTESEARRLKTCYNDSDSSLIRLNTLLRTLNSDTIALRKGSQYARYLCQEATKSFSFHTPSNVTNAGASTTYHLRLLHTMMISSNPTRQKGHRAKPA